MSFFKNVASSFVGASLAFIVSGALFSVLFVGIFIGGIVSAFSEAEPENVEPVSKENTVLRMDLSGSITERSTQNANLSLGGFEANSTLGLRDIV
jgi:hypothetical protein